MAVDLTKEVEISITADDIAEAFTSMCCEDQASALLEIAELMHSWAPHMRLMQISEIARELWERSDDDGDLDDILGFLDQLAADIRERVKGG